jgi:hypothetical protein
MAQIKPGRRMPERIVPMTTEPTVDPDTSRIRAAYFRNRRNYFSSINQQDSEDGFKHIARYDGGHDDATGKNYNTPVWPSILKFLRANKIDNFEGFITAQFQYIPGLSSQWQVPKPTVLKNDRALTNYINYSTEALNVFRRALTTQLNIFDGEQLAAIKRTDPNTPYLPAHFWLMVLRDTSNELTPLFRYCIGVAQQFGEIINAFEASSLTQFLLDPTSYKTYWDSMLPPQFKVPIYQLLELEKSMQV